MLQKSSVDPTTKNHSIVTVFLSEFYQNKRLELFEIISPTFTYYTPFCGKLNFLEYIHWMENLATKRSVVKISLPDSDDGTKFTHEFTMKVLDFKAGFEEDLKGKTTIIVRNGLIEHVENMYEAETINPQQMQKVATKFIENIM